MSEYISHHGIMGMKWGLRRYQNPDGSLTEAGKKRYAKVSESKRRIAKDTREARAILEVNNFWNNRDIKRSNKKSEKAKLRGNFEKAEKYTKAAKEFIQKKEYLSKKLDDLNSGKMRAGRDFVIQRDYNLEPLAFIMPTFTGATVYSGVGLSQESRIIEKGNKQSYVHATGRQGIVPIYPNRSNRIKEKKKR